MISNLPLLPNLIEVYRRWQDDDGGLMAAAVAYYAALSLLPLLLILTSGMGLVLQYTAWGQDAEQQVLAAISDYASPAVRDNVATMLTRVQRQAAFSGPVAMFMLLFTAAALFAQFERAFDRIWNVEDSGAKGFLNAAKNVLFHRLRAFAMLLALGLLLLVVFAAGMVLSSLKAFTGGLLPFVGWVWWLVEIGMSVTLNTCVFTLLYRLLPKVTIRWSEAVRGAVLAAVLWEASRLVLAAFVVGDKYSAYGVIGSFLAIMLWVYISVTIVFLGAEYVQVICRSCGDGANADK